MDQIKNILRARFAPQSRLGGLLRKAHEFYIRAVAGRRGLEWELNGESYRIDPAYRGLIGHEYDADLARFLAENIQAGDICFNVGANIGVYALQLSRWSGPDGKVVAFEPNPTARAVIHRHVSFNGLDNRVQIEGSAVSNETGQTVLFTTGADARGRLGAPNPGLTGQSTEVVVPLTTLDAFFKSNDIVPKWILIDIEGFEIQALEGARSLITAAGRDLQIVVEMHPNVWDSANTNRQRAEAVIEELGLEVVPLSGQGDSLAEYGHVLMRRAESV